MNEQENCRWFDSNLNAYLDGELDRETRDRMNEHAKDCLVCGQKLETMTRLLTMCAEMDEGLTVPLEAQAAWRKAVRGEAEGRRKTRRVGAWTRGMGWIAAALTLLTVSTAMLRQGVTTAPAQLSDMSPKMPVEAMYDTSAAYGGAIEDRADSGTISLSPDGAVEDSGATVDQQVIKNSGSERTQVVLRSASYSTETTAYDTDSQNIDNLVTEYVGYYEADSQNGQPIKPGESIGRQRDMMIRVPSAQLDEFLASLDVIGSVVFKSKNAEDVSSQYYDASARLTALKTQRDQINKLMGTATDLTAVVELQDKFYDLQAEIDSLEGRIRGWDSRADYAQVTVHLSEVPVRNQVQPVGDSLIERIRTGFFDSVNWLSGFLQDMAVMLAAAAPVLVILIPVVILIIVIVRVIRARRRR
jgi:anti-sigma factor RsiW